MAHNYLLSLFDKSLSTNSLLYIVIFSIEIIYFYFNGGSTFNYIYKIPFYILTLLSIDFLIMNFNLNTINILKGNFCFLIVESYFGHIFNIYELGGIFVNIMLSFYINNIFKNKRDKAN